MSEAWNEIADFSRPSVETSKAFVMPKPPKHYIHEPESITGSRRARNLEAIFKIFPDAKIEVDTGVVVASIKDKKFEFHPSSDTFFSYSKNHFGFGIESLLEKIKRHLF